MIEFLAVLLIVWVAVSIGLGVGSLVTSDTEEERERGVALAALWPIYLLLLVMRGARRL